MQGRSLTSGWLFFTKQTILIASSFSGMLSGSGGRVGSKSFWATVSWADSKACYKWKHANQPTHKQRSCNSRALKSKWSENRNHWMCSFVNTDALHMMTFSFFHAENQTMEVLRTIPLFLVENLQKMKYFYLELGLRMSELQFQGKFYLYLCSNCP